MKKIFMATYSEEKVCPVCTRPGPYAVYATSWETGYDENAPIYIVTQTDDEECRHQESTEHSFPVTIDV